MTNKVALNYCTFDPDRRGNERYYVRKRVGGKFRKIRIHEQFRGTDGQITPAFMAAYLAALAELDGAAARRAVAAVPRKDTFDWLVDQYLRSDHVRAMKPSTRADKRSVLTRFCVIAGPLPYRKYRPKHMMASQAKRRDTPGAADKLVKYIRALFSWAIAQELADFNPAAGIPKISEATPMTVQHPSRTNIDAIKAALREVIAEREAAP